MGFLPADKIGTQCDMLSGSLTAVAKTFSVTTGQGSKFQTGNFYLLLGANAPVPEVVHISNRSVDTFTMDARGLTTNGVGEVWSAGTSVQVVYPANVDDMFAHITYLSDMMAYLTQGGVNNVATATTAVAATNQVIPTVGIAISRCTVAANASAAVLAAGIRDGQQVIVENQDASHTITFAASGTSNVADGTSDVVAALSASMFEWNAAKALWYKVN